jgi:hypothetical protein
MSEAPKEAPQRSPDAPTAPHRNEFEDPVKRPSHLGQNGRARLNHCGILLWHWPLRIRSSAGRRQLRP